MEPSNDFLKQSICKLIYPFVLETARKGRYKDAEELLKFILDHDSSPEYLLLLGKVYAQQGRYDEAIIQWRKALEIDPDNQEIKAAIQRAEALSKPLYMPSEVFKKKLAYVMTCILLLVTLGVSFSLWKSKKDSQFLVVKYGEIEKQFEALKKNSDLVDIARKTLAEKGFSDFSLTINHNNGHILIKGDVPSRYLKDIMGKVVKHLKGVESVDVTDVGVSHQYSVSQGDTLGKIAQRLYGNHEKWNVIFAANQDKINTPDQLAPGISLYIP